MGEAQPYQATRSALPVNAPCRDKLDYLEVGRNASKGELHEEEIQKEKTRRSESQGRGARHYD